MTTRLPRLVFGLLDPTGDTWSESAVVVVPPEHLEAYRVALQRVADRAMAVDDAGIEHSQMKPDGPAEELGTPSYASVTADDGELHLYVDCRSMVGQRRSTTLRRILRAELDAVGLARPVVRPTPGDVEEAASYADEAPSEVPSWVPSGGALAGYPDQLDPPDLHLVQTHAELTHSSQRAGWAPRETWWTGKTFVHPGDVDTAFLEAVRRMMDHFELDHMIELFDFDWEDAGLTYREAGHVTNDRGLFVTVMDVRKVRPKPPYLRGHSEPTILALSVATPRDPAKVRRGTFLDHQIKAILEP